MLLQPTSAGIVPNDSSLDSSLKAMSTYKMAKIGMTQESARHINAVTQPDKAAAIVGLASPGDATLSLTMSGVL